VDGTTTKTTKEITKKELKKNGVDLNSQLSLFAVVFIYF